MPEINPHIPTWVQLPTNNNRSAYRAFGLPIILMETDRRDILGAPIDNSGVIVQNCSCNISNCTCMGSPLGSCPKKTAGGSNYQCKGDNWLPSDNLPPCPTQNPAPINSWETCVGCAVRIVIENVPHKSLVAGPDHIGLYSPDHEIYAKNISISEMMDRLIPVEVQTFYRITSEDGPIAPTLIDFSEAVGGDLMQYTSATGVTDVIKYYPTADYYDLSDIKIETEELPPGVYNLLYQVEYYVRVVSDVTPDQLNCIDISQKAVSVYPFKLNHPGQVMEETVRLTPAVYMTSDRRSQDSTIEFYRPFTDILQDVFDEQNLLGSINWVDKITPAFVPYLCYLLGLDMPYFPTSVLALRKTMLRNVVRLQQLKGSNNAIYDLFELFGYIVRVNNLYWSQDGMRLIRPGETLPPKYSSQEIEVVRKCQVEPVLVGYDGSKPKDTNPNTSRVSAYGELTIPLLYRPDDTNVDNGIDEMPRPGTVMLDAYLVKKNSTLYTQLEKISCNAGTSAEGCRSTPGSYGPSVNCMLPLSITKDNEDELVGYSKIVIDSSKSVGTSETLSGAQPPFIKGGVALDRKSNLMKLTFNGAIQFDDIYGTKEQLALYTFVTYNRLDYVVPASLTDLFSNRFDLQLWKQDGEQIPSDVLEFLVDFLFKLKAFHSLLNVIIYKLTLNETYQVTDFCLGGDIQQRANTDAGKLQVPPAIIPSAPKDGRCGCTLDGACYLDPKDLGYKDEDIALREIILSNLPEEFKVWSIVSQYSATTCSGYKSDSIVRNIGPGGNELLAPTLPVGTTCEFNYRGQNRSKTGAIEAELTDITYDPTPFASSSSVASQSNLVESPIRFGLHGVFDATGADASSNNDSSEYGASIKEYLAKTTTLCTLGGSDYCYKGRVNDELLCRATLLNTEQYQATVCTINFGYGVYYAFPATKEVYNSVQGKQLRQSYDTPIVQNNFLGRLLRAYDTVKGENIHYTNRPSVGMLHIYDIQLIICNKPITIRVKAHNTTNAQSIALNQYPIARVANITDLNAPTTTISTDTCLKPPSYILCPPRISLELHTYEVQVIANAWEDGAIQLSSQMVYIKAYNCTGASNIALNKFNSSNPSVSKISRIDTVVDSFGENNLLALQRPSLNIQAHLMHFPGTRFATLNKLESDFTHPFWMAKPWDDNYSNPCGSYDNPCSKPTYLNAELIENTEGDSVLSFDSVPFMMYGNGLQQDIPNFGSHNLGTEWSFSENDVIHSIYSDKANGNPAVELEGVVESPSGTAGGFIETGEPLYSSAAKCGTSYTDFIDGYPASYGYQPYVDDDFDRSGLYTELFDALGIERAMPTGTEVLFSFISGILHETGHRLGCGCAVPICGATEEETLLDCSLNLYLTDEGYDYNPDKVDWIPTLVADDLIGVNDNSFDNRITSMFELCPPNNQWCSLSKPMYIPFRMLSLSGDI